jgi:hypothetical protein
VNFAGSDLRISLVQESAVVKIATLANLKYNFTRKGGEAMPENQTAATPSTQEIAARGEAIYKEKYQTEFEKRYLGQFVAINIFNQEATVSDTGEEAIRTALQKDPSGYFHLMRVGHKAAFDAGWYLSCVH